MTITVIAAHIIEPTIDSSTYVPAPADCTIQTITEPGLTKVNDGPPESIGRATTRHQWSREIALNLAGSWFANFRDRTGGRAGTEIYRRKQKGDQDLVRDLRDWPTNGTSLPIGVEILHHNGLKCSPELETRDWHLCGRHRIARRARLLTNTNPHYEYRT